MNEANWSPEDTMGGAKVFNREAITEAAAMAFADPHHIPERYARADDAPAGAAAAVVGDDESHELPVVDMAKLLDPEHRAVEIACLGSACRSWGFFQLINHGADDAVIQQMKDDTVQFFELPVEEKKAVAVRPGGGIEGFGHHFNRSSTDKLDWAESLIVETQPIQRRNLQFWPSNPPTFRDSIDKYAMEMRNLATRLLGFMACDLGVEQGTLLAAFAGKRQSMVLHRYPPCRRPEEVVGIAPHSDGFGLTLLLQVDDTPGLQVMLHGGGGGRWLPVRPLPGALVVNVGEILELLTNGAYRSAFHRVVVDAERGRTTVVVFQDASVGGVVGPLPELGEPRYRAIGRSEYGKGHATEILGSGERFIDTLRTIRLANVVSNLHGE